MEADANGDSKFLGEVRRQRVNEHLPASIEPHPVSTALRKLNAEGAAQLAEFRGGVAAELGADREAAWADGRVIISSDLRTRHRREPRAVARASRTRIRVVA